MTFKMNPKARVQVFENPRPHIVIDDFLPTEYIEDFLKEIEVLKPQLVQGEVEETVSEQKIINEELKKNKIVWLTDYYRGRDADSFIVSALSNILWSSEFIGILESQRCPLFEFRKYVESDSLMLSAYADGDYYDYHIDLGSKESYITSVLTLFREPKVFSGGDFKMTWKDDTKIVECINNRLVVFPSGLAHGVEPIISKSEEFMDSRFSMQHFSWRENDPAK